MENALNVIENANLRMEAMGRSRPYLGSPAQKSKTVTLQITNSVGVRSYFDPDSQLDNSIIRAIEFVDTTTSVSNPHVKNASGDFLANPSAAELAGMVFGLAHRNEVVATMPAVTMIRRLNAGKYTYFNSENHIWQDCYVEITGSTFALAVITVRVWFDDKE